jgi:hypothetical protein
MLSVLYWLPRLAWWGFGLLAGKKTFIIAAAHLAYAVAGVFLGLHDWNTFVQLVLTGLGLGTLRSGMHRIGK